MKGARRLLGVLLATAVAALVAVPPAQATIFERFRFDDAYSFTEEICGIEVQIEGTVSGHGRIRTGKGKLATAFFGLFNVDYSETWTAANRRFVTVTGSSIFNEVKAVPLGGNLFRFTAVEAGQPFRLYDSEGVLVLRDRGVIRGASLNVDLAATPAYRLHVYHNLGGAPGAYVLLREERQSSAASSWIGRDSSLARR